MNSVRRKSLLYISLAWGAIILVLVTWIILQPQSTTSAVTDNLLVRQTKHPSDNKSLIKAYPFNEAVNKSNLIAEVVIKDKKKEVDDPSPKTIFEAEVNNVLKGNLKRGSTIHVLQEGNSAETFHEIPMFQFGESYVLILMEAIGLDDNHTYWILGAQTGVYQVVAENTLIKWAKSEDAFKSIEILESQLETANEHISTIKAKLRGQDTQMLLKDKFKKMVKSELRGQDD